MARLADWRIIVATATVVGASMATAQVPAWRPGDRWRFVENDGLASAAAEWEAQVAQVGTDRLAIAIPGRSEVRFDGNLNPVGPARQAGMWPRFRFPLVVGDRWQDDRSFSRETVQGNETSTWTVEAEERITVPAGTFDCIRLTGRTFRSWTNATMMNQSFNKTQVDETVWYCPAVKWMARRVVRSQSGTASPVVTTRTELAAYVPAP